MLVFGGRFVCPLVIFFNAAIDCGGFCCLLSSLELHHLHGFVSKLKICPTIELVGEFES